MATAPDSITTALAPSRQAFFHSLWREHYPKLNLTSASDLFTSDLELAETLLSWLQDSDYDPPRSITALSPPSTTQKTNNQPTIHLISEEKETVPDDAFSHALAHVTIYRASQTLSTLKQIFYALRPKGVALVTVTKSNPVDTVVQSILSTSGRRRSLSSGLNEIPTEDSLRTMAESAGFELGKIRILSREVVVQGEALEVLRGEMLKILDKGVGMQGDGQSWEKGFDEGWEREVNSREGDERGLRVECWVLVVRKWDLLCA